MRLASVSIILVFFIVLLSCYASAVVIQHFRYDRASFNCKDMSYELAGFLKGLGLHPSVVYAHRVNDSGRVVSAHCWMRCCGVDIESTRLIPGVGSGWIIDDIKEI